MPWYAPPLVSTPMLRTTPRGWRVAALVIVASGLGACAAATPGYVPPTDAKSGLARVKPFDSGTVSDAGVYVPSAAERQLDCKRLAGSMQIIISRLKDTANRPEVSPLAVQTQAAVTAVRGTKPVLEIPAETARERGRLVAFNGLLAEKKCKTINLDAELAPLKTKP
jgi:hypothetical protein